MLEKVKKLLSNLGKIKLTEREAAAKKIKKLRKGEMENSGFYNRKREMHNYIFQLGGIRKFLEHARKLKSNLVLDIGAGNTIAIGEIAKSEIGKGLKFEATVLTRNKNIGENLGFKNTHITSVEVLRGIKDESVGAIITVYALPYVTSPKLAIKSIDRVLVKGGIFKAQLTISDLKSRVRKQDGRNIISYDPFIDELIKLNYDVAFDDSTTTPVVLAIKQGGDLKISAWELMREGNDIGDIAVE